MLWDASSIRGYCVIASSAQAGTVEDFIFDEADWTIAWLAVESGGTLPRRFYVPVTAFEQPDPEQRQITLRPTSAGPGHFPASEIDQLGARARSLFAIEKAAVEATDDDVGHVHDYLIDTATWQIEYLVITPSDWSPDDKVLVPTHTVAAVDYPQTLLKLDVTRQFVKDGPHYDPRQTIDGACNESFLTYYGMRLVKK